MEYLAVARSAMLDGAHKAHISTSHGVLKSGDGTKFGYLELQSWGFAQWR